MRRAVSQSLRVLLVENHPDTLQMLTFYLEEMGYEVTSARTIAEAVGVLRSLDIDIMISDIGLPDGRGWELMEQVPRKVFAVAMSGLGVNEDRARSRAAGFRHHLLKPFRAAELDKILLEAATELGRFPEKPAMQANEMHE